MVSAQARREQVRYAMARGVSTRLSKCARPIYQRCGGSAHARCSGVGSNFACNSLSAGVR